MIFITIVDIKPGQDEQAYEVLQELKVDSTVTPLLIGRTFEEADIILLLHSDDMEVLDDYVIENVRNLVATEELVVIPIYEFTLLPSFDSVVELESEQTDMPPERGPGEALSEFGELLLFIVRFDVASGMDREVHRAILSIQPEDDTLMPLMSGHTFHSKEFDLLLFFLSKDIESTWEFSKILRAVNGVRDTDLSLIAHFEALVPLEQFRKLASSGRTLELGRKEHE